MNLDVWRPVIGSELCEQITAGTVPTTSVDRPHTDHVTLDRMAAGLMSPRDIAAVVWCAEHGQGCGKPKRRHLVTRKASEVVPQAVQWLWVDDFGGRIPLGELMILVGRGNVGKSPFTLAIAAALSRGRFAGALHGRPMRTYIYATEDDFQRTIVPRLMAQGADLRYIELIEATVDETGTAREIDWTTDLDLIHEAMAQNDVALVIIDPVIEVLSNGDTNNNRDVSIALRTLSQMAQETLCTVIGLAHARKDVTNLSDVINGSVAWRNKARLVVVMALDPSSPNRRLLHWEKNNYGKTHPELPGYACHIDGIDVALPGGETANVPRFVLDETTADSAADLLRPVTGADSAAGADERFEWVADLLAAGPVPTAKIESELYAHEPDAKWNTFSIRLKRSGSFVARKSGGRGAPWVWELTDAGRRAYQVDVSDPFTGQRAASHAITPSGFQT